MLAAFHTQCEALQDEDETEGSLDSDESSDERSDDESSDLGPLTEDFEEKEIVRWRILIPMGDSACQRKGPQTKKIITP